MKHQIKCAETEQIPMFYTSNNPVLKDACVGHVRIDFGSDNEFWHTWWGNRDDLNDGTFKSELNDVINELRKDGLLKNRNEMQRYCGTHKSIDLNGSYGFSVESENHIFLLRCRPERGNYDCYMYCYNKHELRLSQSDGNDELPSPEMSL